MAWDTKNFSVNVVIEIRNSGVTIRLSTVYGTPYEEGKDQFFSELHELFLNWDGPTMIRGNDTTRKKAISGAPPFATSASLLTRHC
jgi:hypothetical protein